MNRIINKYGAFDYGNPVAAEFDNLSSKFEQELSAFIKKHDLSPEELRSLHSCLSMSPTIAEHLILKGINMRKVERESKRKEEQNLLD